VTMQLKKTDSVIVLIGQRKAELGGSAYYAILEELCDAKKDALLGNTVPRPDFATANAEMVQVLDLISSEAVLSSHDISDGGIALALFEMTLPQRKVGGTIGLDITLDALPGATDTILFSETGGFLLEMNAEDAEKAGLSGAIIGRTTADSQLTITQNGTEIINTPLSVLASKWSDGLCIALKG